MGRILPSSARGGEPSVPTLTPTSDARLLLAENTTLSDRLWGKLVGVWRDRGREVWCFGRAYRRPIAIILRVRRSGPWPHLANLRDGREVNLGSNREAWMHAHNHRTHHFRMARFETLDDGAAIVEFVNERTHSQAVIRFPVGVGDPGIFLSGEYGELPVEARTVVDVGAGAGESAIYFSLEGAERVIAFEPLPAAFEVAVQNVACNDLEERINLVPSAVGAQPGVIRLERGASAATTRALTAPEGSVSIPVTTLRQIVERFSLTDASLKIDCEGDEYGLILAAPPAVLRRFQAMVIEYHYGARSLTRCLEAAGFRVRVHAPTFVPGSPTPGRYFGLLTARRIDER